MPLFFFRYFFQIGWVKTDVDAELIGLETEL
jgi:hypothetical protein